MTIPPSEEIGEEVPEDDSSAVSAGEAVLVPGGTRHNFRNTADSALRLWTGYAPPEHPTRTVHGTKAEADAAEHH
jgi:mannose-6-phosphate isomerase-like protein (cupin superfamily)